MKRGINLLICVLCFVLSPTIVKAGECEVGTKNIKNVNQGDVKVCRVCTCDEDQMWLCELLEHRCQVPDTRSEICSKKFEKVLKKCKECTCSPDGHLMCHALAADDPNCIIVVPTCRVPHFCLYSTRGFSYGSTYIIEGRTLPQATRFAVHLLRVPNSYLKDDVVFQIAFIWLVDDQRVVMNHFDAASQQWSEGELIEGMPLLPGDDFKMSIWWGDQRIEVELNDEHFYQYGNDLAPYDVTYVMVSGDAIVDKFDILEGTLK